MAFYARDTFFEISGNSIYRNFKTDFPSFPQNRYILRRQSEGHHALFFICLIYVYTLLPGAYGILGLCAQCLTGAA